MRLLLNYDYSAYPFTTASYIEMEAKKLPDVELVKLTDKNTENIDLILNIMPFDALCFKEGVPSAYWEIDNHMVKGTKKPYYDRVDAVYVPQKPFLDFYPKDKTRILPLACEPDVHCSVDGVEPEYDIGFIGNDTYPERRELLDRLERKYNTLRTTTQPGLPYSEALNKCKLTFNRSMDRDVNMRFFEAIASGRMLLTDYLPQQDDFATFGLDYQIYTDWADLDKKVQYYLEHPFERTLIAMTGQKQIRSNHTYKHRLLQVLKDFGWIMY